MRFLLVLVAVPLLAAVEGTVVNQTTGKPQANVILQLIQPGQGGMQTLGTAKSDTAGKFKIDKPAGEGPSLVQAIYGGVTYTKMIQPGTPSSGIEVAVFDASNKAGTAQLNQRAIILQPSDTGLQVSEMYLMRNTSKVTYNDPANGTVRFFVPPGHGDLSLMVNAPGSMPVQRAAQPAGAANTFKLDYPLKPGETRLDLNYTLDAKQYSGKTLMEGGETRIVVPDGVSIEGEGLDPLGAEPQTKAKIFGVKAAAFTVKVSGSGTMNVEAAGGSGAAQEEDPGRPEIKQVMPRIYDKLYVVLGLSLAVLALGFTLLYRSRKA